MIDEQMVTKQISEMQAMSRDEILATCDAIDARSDQSLASVYGGRMVGTIREVSRRARLAI